MKLHQHAKKSFYFISFFLRNSQFLHPQTSDHTHFLTMPTPIFFNQLLFSINLYHIKKSGYFIILFQRFLILSCNLIGQDHFQLYLRKQIFPKHRILCRNIANTTNFHYKPNLEKINEPTF